MAEPRSRERSLLTKALSPSDVCATPFELTSLGEGSLAEPAAARLRDHLSGCPRCQTELTLLNYFENAAPRPDEERTVRWISTRLEAETIGGPSPLQARQSAELPRRSVAKGLNLGGFALAAAALGADMTIGVLESCCSGRWSRKMGPARRWRGPASSASASASSRGTKGERCAPW